MTFLVSRKELEARKGKGGKTEKEEKTKGRTISEHFSLTSLEKTNFSMNSSNSFCKP